MNNLFSIFDPSNGVFNSNWLSMAIFFLLPISSFWMTPNPMKAFLYFILSKLENEISMTLNLKANNGMTFLILTLFFYILSNNFFGLLPYIFTSTSHISFNLSLSLPLWTGFILYSFSLNFTLFMAHLVPSGTPTFLIPFMVFIELISNVMRPFTLAVRLTANMIAGHLLLALVSLPMYNLDFLKLTLAFMALMILMVLEIAVSLIQAYVFVTLSSLYLAEVNYPNL